MVSHLTVEEGSEKINDFPKVVWLEVSKVGFELGSLWLMKLYPSVYHISVSSVSSGCMVVQVFLWTETEDPRYENCVVVV